MKSLEQLKRQPQAGGGAPDEIVQQAIEAYEALAGAVLAKLPSEQAEEAELHIALIRAATSLTLEARAGAARKQVPSPPAQRSQRDEGGDRRGGGRQQDRRGGFDRGDRGGRGQNRGPDRGRDFGRGAKPQLPGFGAYCDCGCGCYSSYEEGQAGACPNCDCDCRCKGRDGEQLRQIDGQWRWVKAA